MSGDSVHLVAHDADEQLSILAEDRPPFTQAPDWVLFAPLTAQAKALYWALAAHANPGRGDGQQVWPTRETLAELLGMGRPQSVDRYLDELAEFGAIRVERQRVGRMKARNRYFVRFNPPVDYSGPSSATTFYRQRRAAALGIAIVKPQVET